MPRTATPLEDIFKSVFWFVVWIIKSLCRISRERVLIVVPDYFGQFAVFVVLGLPERHVHSGRKEAQRSEKALRSWSDVSHRGEEVLRVRFFSLPLK